MTRKYKLQRLQKNILLGVSGVTLASSMLFGGTPNVQNKPLNIDTIITSPSEVKTLNKAQKESMRYYTKNSMDDDEGDGERNL